MSNSGSLAARNIRIIPDEIGGSTPLIFAVLQENHTSNLLERQITKTAKMGCGKSDKGANPLTGDDVSYAVRQVRVIG
jgi:hypothetical protein